VKVAQKNLDDATISANINGTVVTVDVKEGDVVTASSLNPNSPIYLVDTATIQISAQIDEIDIAGVQPGQKVVISLDSLPESKYEGKVTAISMAPIANPQNSGVIVYEVIINFVNSPPPEVKLGMSATVDIITSERTGVVMIPNRAVREDSSGNPVVSVMVNEKIEEKPVKLGLSDGINTEVISGLSAGDTIVIVRNSEGMGIFGQ
jgi:HlyD family secretion protein